MRIGEWAENNYSGNWSDNWRTKDGTRIACPECGCTTVSPVNIDEFLSHVRDASEDMNDKDKEDSREYHLLNSLKIRESELEGEVPNVNKLNMDEVENFHRKHGIFCCANEDCSDEGNPYFSPKAIPRNSVSEAKIWNDEKKKSMGYNNPWNIAIEKPNANKDNNYGDLW